MNTSEFSLAGRAPMLELGHLPALLTVDEAAQLLRTTPKAIRNLHDRRRLPGAVKFGKRLLIRRDDLLRSLQETRVLPLKGREQ